MRRMGNTLFTAGHLPVDSETGQLITGKVGRDLTIQEGHDAARAAAINMIATLKEELGDLDKVKSIVKVSVGAAYGSIGPMLLGPRRNRYCSELIFQKTLVNLQRHDRECST